MKRGSDGTKTKVNSQFKLLDCSKSNCEEIQHELKTTSWQSTCNTYRTKEAKFKTWNMKYKNESKITRSCSIWNT